MKTHVGKFGSMAALAAALLLTACAERSDLRQPASHGCELRKLAERGTSGTVNLVLSTDGLTYATVSEPSCPSDDALYELAPADVTADPSVATFFDAQDAYCKKSNQPALCVVDISLKADVNVTPQGGSGFLVTLRKVRLYEFRYVE